MRVSVSLWKYQASFLTPNPVTSTLISSAATDSSAESRGG